MLISRWIFVLGLLVLMAAAPRETAAAEPIRIRVLSYNIHHGEGMDGKLDLERIAGVIRSVDPDVVGLQEVDRGARRTGGVDQPRELARMTNMTASFGGNIKLQGGEYGNAVLTRLPETGRRNVLLPSRLDGEQRGVLIVDLTAADARKTPIRFMVTHLDHRPDDAERMDSVKRIEEVARENPSIPTILAGDLNTKPDSPVMAAFGANWTRTDSTPLLSFPAPKPKVQIDFVQVRPAARWKVVETRVLEEPVASDHRPLLAVLELVD